ncbi:aminotransferase class I/II-fold pyridoxal phosphate-dependent enzyme [Lachnospiraceae bacterium]|nr:aminotransferase class I/II-fold pyridoxal phosphate-dependent enzyme [Lachnospiraceae bacterium]
MNEGNFKLLRDIAEQRLSIEDALLTIEGKILAEQSLLDRNGITAKGEKQLAPYRADNAIIMAAGYSARCMPLSNIMPKGLFKVKGEILIEREIRQLLEAGITDIILVTGFQAEKFEYLKEKYGVSIVVNKNFDKYNNIASLYEAQSCLKNSYILCSDNYYEENVFHKYVYAPYYSCVYSETYCDEFCVTKTGEDGRILNIHRGGERSWYTIGDCYFNAELSEKFCHFMNREWSDLKVRNMLMDDFHIRHIRDLPLKKQERPRGSILEFDTLEEIKEFDPGFQDFIKENLDKNNPVNQVFFKYSDVKSYHSVPTEQLGGRLHLNENLFKPSPKCLEVLKNITMEDLYLYDLGHSDALLDTLADSTGISANNIFVHNGSAEVIKSIFSILLNEGDHILIPAPGWSYYQSVADEKFAKCVSYEVREAEESYEYNIADILKKAEELQPKMIILTTPQMPTGCVIPYPDIEQIIAQNEHSVIMIDEAYWGYGIDDNVFEKKIITKYSNVVITRTFSKFYGLANIRIGYGLCSYPLRRTIGLDLPLFRASGISRKIAIAALCDTRYYQEMKQKTNEIRNWFIRELNRLPHVKAFQSSSNYVFIKLLHADADKIRAYMEENGILIRLFRDKDALRLRITIGPKDIMERVLYQLKRALMQ